MKYYRDSQGMVFAFEADGSQDDFIKDDMILMTPEEVEAHINPPVPEPSEEDIINAHRYAIQAHMDAQAQALGYDDIRTAVTYAEEPAVPKFQEEGKAFRAWRSMVWDYAYTQLDLVKAGEREAPTVEQMIDELPEAPHA